MSKKLTTEAFIQKAKQVHGNKYNYSKVEYKNSYTKICILCQEHGEFWQTPNCHLSKRGCFKCSHKYFFTSNDFIEIAKKIHKNKYDYSKINYIKSNIKVCIICPKHGEFWQTPSNHLSGKGCYICGGTKLLILKDFIKKAKILHNNKYNYSNSIYIGNHIKICILCPKHGNFLQTPKSHLQGCGCPKCQRSKGEETIEKYLKENNIQYEPQKRFKDCKNKNPLPFDFYLPHFNICIEFQGRQHYIPIFGIKSFKQTQFNDNIKDQYCFNNCISFIKIPFNQQNQIEKLLSFIIS